jgi:23S rRNA (pseudouridine1915-N3)-methyltransferase
MSRLRFVWLGKTKEAALRQLIEEYDKRLKRFARCEFVELPDSQHSSTRDVLIDDSKRLAASLSSSSSSSSALSQKRVLLDVEGESLSSHDVAEKLRRWQNESVRSFTFVIGGPEGVSRDILAPHIDESWSLSPMTFTHEMARVLLLEQLYRGFSIISNMPYQK